MPRVSLLVVNTKLGIPAAGTSVRAGCLQGGTGVEVILQPTCWVVRDNEECGRRTASISEVRGLNAHTDDSGKQWSILAFSPDLLKFPKYLKKQTCFLPDWSFLFPHCYLPYCTATFTPILLYGAETNKALATFHYQMWDGWCSLRCPGLEWVNLNRFRVWILQWQM